MRDSLTIGRIAGISVGINWSWLIVFALIAWTLAVRFFPLTYPGLGSRAYWVMGAVAAIVFFGSILLHELGHALTAVREGVKIEGITLWLFGGVARFSSRLPSPASEFRISIAGPLVSLVLTVAFALAGALWQALPAPATGVLDYLARINALVLGFNLVPALPLDGGRMLQAGLWPRTGYRRATLTAVFAGFVFLIILGIYGLVINELLWLLLALFMYTACKQEWFVLETGGEESLFGYDFSQGYTSLEQDDPPRPKKKRLNFVQRWLQRRKALKIQREQEREQAEARRVDELLDKIQKMGKDALTDEEHRFLKRYADRMKNK